MLTSVRSFAWTNGRPVQGSDDGGEYVYVGRSKLFKWSSGQPVQGSSDGGEDVCVGGNKLLEWTAGSLCRAAMMVVTGEDVNVGWI